MYILLVLFTSTEANPSNIFLSTPFLISRSMLRQQNVLNCHKPFRQLSLLHRLCNINWLLGSLKLAWMMYGIQFNTALVCFGSKSRLNEITVYFGRGGCRFTSELSCVDVQFFCIDVG